MSSSTPPNTANPPSHKHKWDPPSKPPVPVLKIRNSLTKNLEEFVPISGKNVSMYICGPTVYDTSHMGHARTYLSFDVIRRILEDYFNYDVHYAMNITDVEDKIILGARKTHLYHQFVTTHPLLNAEVVQTVEEARLDGIQRLQAKLKKEQEQVDQAKEKGLPKDQAEATAKVELFGERIKALQDHKATLEEAMKNDGGPSGPLLLQFKNQLSDLLDAKFGESVTDPKVFREFAARYEQEFYEDLDRLNIRFPDVVTRVSEYIPHIVNFIQKIQSKGFAYETKSTVYFDTVAFGEHPNHAYAKLMPTAVGDKALMEEGEGELAGETSEKRSPNDFALWKKAKPGEPVWDSPWGAGRPGWHIECSAMAGDTFGSKIDIHCGGVDLKFPHHDNELAQSEAFFGHNQWVNYFLHSGHLNIRGLKMARSLKNFLSIREALQSFTPRQLRLLFLLQSWDNVMYFEDSAIEEVKAREKTFKEFFLTVEAALRDQRGIAEMPQLWGVKERVLYATLKDVEAEVHKHLCNNFDTSSAMNALNNLVTKVNGYSMKNPSRNAMIMKRVAVYITRMLRVFGVISDEQNEFGFPEMREQGKGSSSILPSVLNAFAQFRSQIRQGVKDGKELAHFMLLCNQLRDEVMPPLGVRFEDAGDFPWKLISKQDLLSMKDEKKKEARDKLVNSKAALDNEIDRWDRFSMSAEDRLNAQYSEYDKDGTPTVDIAGKPIKKNAAKFQKEVEKMKQDHQKYLAKLAENPNFMAELKHKSKEYTTKIEELDKGTTTVTTTTHTRRNSHSNNNNNNNTNSTTININNSNNNSSINKPPLPEEDLTSTNTNRNERTTSDTNITNTKPEEKK